MNTLDAFIEKWDDIQRQRHREIPLFNPELTAQWTTTQKQYFVKTFYHTRGHFDRLLWTRLCYARTAEEKRTILGYIAEEVGLQGIDDTTTAHPVSHEQLFGVFAQSMGVSLTPELTERDYYLPFAKEFSDGLIAWFRTHDSDSGNIAFPAYERLDNIDYEELYKIALSIGVSGQALAYFEVHRYADHFEKTSGKLPEYWRKNQRKVEEAFAFIGDHQLKMWKGLSDAVFYFPSTG